VKSSLEIRMTLTKEQIRTAAMELDAVEREALAEELLLSISGEDRASVDAAWLAEVQRRDNAFRSRQTPAKPVDEVIDRLMKKAHP
jgi:hypothetical protein